jgi:hypothetical protein
MRSPRALAAALLLGIVSCTEPRVAGVLTLAPAGMMLSDGAVGESDGTARLPLGSSATATSYAPRGELLAAVVGAAEGSGQVVVEMYFDGQLLAKLAFAGGEERKEIRVPVERDGAHTWRFVVQAEEGRPGGAFHFKKLVIRIA